MSTLFGLRAYLHSVSNVGISVGTVVPGVAIAAGTHLAYQMVMVADAGTFLGAALLLLLVPRVAPPVAPETQPSVDRRWVAVRDGRYLALTAANTVMSLQYFVLAFAMPLWVIGQAPRWLVSPMLLTNTVLIACLQVRFSRGTKTPAGGARSVRLLCSNSPSVWATAAAIERDDGERLLVTRRHAVQDHRPRQHGPRHGYGPTHSSAGPVE